MSRLRVEDALLQLRARLSVSRLRIADALLQLRDRLSLCIQCVLKTDELSLIPSCEVVDRPQSCREFWGHHNFNRGLR